MSGVVIFEHRHRGHMWRLDAEYWTQWCCEGIFRLKKFAPISCSVLMLMTFSTATKAENTQRPASMRHTQMACDIESESCAPLKGPWEEYDKSKEIIGAGPHTMLVTNGQTANKFEYATGPACLRARNAVRRQIRATGVIISATTAVCIPR